MHRGSTAIAVLAALFVGLLTVGPVAGCGSQQPAPATPPAPPTTGPATGLPTAAPLPLPRPLPPDGPTPPEPGLGAEDRALLTKARRVGAQWVILLVTTEPPRTAEVSAGLEQLGGVIGTPTPGVDYLRLTMPTDQVHRAAALPGVTALDVEQIINPHNPRPTG